MKKLTYQDVKSRFESLGHVLLILEDEYKNSKQKLAFKCGKCGKLSEVSATSLRRHKGNCIHCHRFNQIRKHSYDYVKSYFENEGCTLLTTEYHNRNQKLEYLCSCGNSIPDKKSFRKFMAGQRCWGCYSDRTKNTIIKKYGGYDEINTKCKKTKLEHYGDENYNNLEKIKETQRKLYGGFGSESPIIKKKVQNTMIERYGVKNYTVHEDFIEKANATRLKNDSNLPKTTYSKESQVIFWQVYEQLPRELQEHTYFGELNREYNIYYEGKIYAYDLVVSSLKKCVEYNGVIWHSHPLLENDATNWNPFKPDLTAAEQRKYDELKINALKESRGYETLVVWDFDDDPVNKILTYLTSNK